MDDVITFVLNKMPLGVIVYNHNLDIIYSNKKAKGFLKRQQLPDEINTICRRIINAIETSSLKEKFPGEIYISKKFKDSPNNWIFSLSVYESPKPYVCIYIIEEKFSNRFDLNDMRKQFRLTRRETDVLRQVLDGLQNSEIAEELEISEQTIKDYLSNIYSKIGVKNRFDLIRFLINSQGKISQY